MQRFSLGFYIVLILGLVVTNISIYKIIYAPKVLYVEVLAVTKGRPTLVRTSNGHTILMNTGPDAGILRSLGENMFAWQRAINTIVLTSGEGLSAGGLPEILNRYRVNTLIRAGAPGSKNLEAAISAAVNTGLNVHQTFMLYGEELIFDAGTHITIVSPETFTISYGSGSLSISSSTPPGAYVLK